MKTFTREKLMTMKPFLIFKELSFAILHHDVLETCAQLSYYFIFALFPFLLFLITLIGYLPISPNEILNLFGYTLPHSVLEFIERNVLVVSDHPKGNLLLISIMTALWSMSTGITALIRALNGAYQDKDTRSFWKVRGIAIIFTISLSFFILLALILLVFGRQLGTWITFYFRLGLFFLAAWNMLRWLSIILLITIAFACLYYFSPNYTLTWQSILPGSFIAVIGWVIISLGFSYYVNHFGSYEAIYGSLGAVIVLMTWLYLSTFIILIGGHFNAILKRIKRD